MTTYTGGTVVNPANIVTSLRLLLTPLLLVLIFELGVSWWVVFLGVSIGASDFLDGWLARRQGTTRTGAFLDPLADKVLVLGVLLSLWSIDRAPLAAVVLISVREIGISIYRSYWARRGVSIPARPIAKLKTLLQGIALTTLMLPPLEDQLWVGTTILWVAVVFTIVTGVQYIVDRPKVNA